MLLTRVLIPFCLIFCLIFSEAVENPENSTGSNGNEAVPKDLYVIKTVVYEVGILTNVENENDTINLNETHEKVDVSFFDPLYNDSAIDLSNIPLPIQTNISGVTVTGLLTPEAIINGSNNPLFPHKQITVVQNISTSNPFKGAQIISNLPQILGLNKSEIRQD